MYFRSANILLFQKNETVLFAFMQIVKLHLKFLSFRKYLLKNRGNEKKELNKLATKLAAFHQKKNK